MTTTRDLCRVLGAALQVRDVERHAAILLLTLLGAPKPEQTTQVAETLMGLPRRLVSVATGLFEGWVPAIEADEACFAPTLGGLIVDGLEYMREEVPNVSLELFTVAQGEADVSVYLRFGPRFYRAQYGMPPASSAGLRTFASVSSAEIRALANSLKPNIARCATEHAMPSLLTH